MSRKLKILIAAAGVLIIPVLILPVPKLDPPHSTVVEAADGTLLGARIADDGQWRFPAYSGVPDKFKKALLTFEDRYFYYHPGINPVALFRAFRQNLKAGQIVTGGTIDPDNRFMAPTVIKDVKPVDPIMKDEIFGPVLPVIEYDHFDEVYAIIEQNTKPLAVYIFTRNKKLIREFLRKTQSGNAAVNDTVIQIASPYLPYGGVGQSGMGRYHGKRSFETFSNMRSVLVKSNLLDVTLRYPPYNRFKEKVINLLMR